MGVLQKLSFWRKSSKATPVQILNEPASEDDEQMDPQIVYRGQDGPTVRVTIKTRSAGSEESADTCPPTRPLTPEDSSSEDVKDTGHQQADVPDSPKYFEASLLTPVSEHEDASQDVRLRLDMPPEQIFENIRDIFGPAISSSLMSSKWDKRAQALKALSSAVHVTRNARGTEKDHRAHQWRVCCQLLQQMMGDKVMPVRLALNDLFLDIFSDVAAYVEQDEIHSALGTLLDCFINKLGDSNLRLHETTRRCVLFCAEHDGMLGLGPVLLRLRSHLAASNQQESRSKVHFGVLDTVNLLLQRFPGHQNDKNADEDEEEEPAAQSWTMQDVSPFIVAGMDDALGPRVRASAVGLAVSVYKTLGAAAVQPMIAGLRPAKQAVLRQKFEESEQKVVHREEQREKEGHTRRKRAKHGAVPLPLQKRIPNNIDSRELAMPGRIVCVSTGSVRQVPGMIEEPPDEEELLMDCILEEAGLVFGTGTIHEPSGYFPFATQEGHSPGYLQAVHGVVFSDYHTLEREHHLLEEELVNLGIDIDSFEEQHALLRIMCASPEQARPVEPPLEVLEVS